MSCFCPRQSLGAVFRNLDVVAFDLEVVAEPVCEIRIVFDDENPLGGHGTRGRGHTGNSMTTRVPTPAIGSSIHARPWCRLADPPSTATPTPQPAPAAPPSRPTPPQRSPPRCPAR